MKGLIRTTIIMMVLELEEDKPYPWQATGATRSRDYDDVIVEIQIIW